MAERWSEVNRKQIHLQYEPLIDNIVASAPPALTALLSLDTYIVLCAAKTFSAIVKKKLWTTRMPE